MINGEDRMERLSASEITAVQLTTLDRFRAAINKENLRYFLHYGSLIGAVRHQGMIPWDDDIDVAMLRIDYDRMEKIDWSSWGLQILWPKNRDDCPYPFAKIFDTSTKLQELMDFPVHELGVGIDVFPIDAASSHTIIRTYERYLIKFLIATLSIKIIKGRSDRNQIKNGILNVGKFLFKPISAGSLTKKIDRVASNHNRKANSMFGCRIGPYGDRELSAYDVFSSNVQKLFENREVHCPIGFHDLLTKVYGDYMTPPAETKRTSHHRFEAFRLSRKSCREVV